MENKLRGIIVAIPTPVDEQEQVDEVSLRRLVRHVLAQGVHGLLANGSMSGFVHQSQDQQMRCLEVILDENAGRVPVIANVGENGTRLAVCKGRRYEALKPDYLGFLPPYYFPLAEPELRRFYLTVLDSVQTPCFLYNHPTFTKNDLSFELICALAEHPNAAGVKDSAQDFAKWMKMVHTFRHTGFSVLVGTDSLISPALILGCDGVVSGLVTICPDLAVTIYEAALRGDRSLTEAMQARINDLSSILVQSEEWGAIEIALQYLGLCQKITVSPFSPVSDARAKRLIGKILSRNINQSVFSPDRNQPSRSRVSAPRTVNPEAG